MPTLELRQFWTTLAGSMGLQEKPAPMAACFSVPRSTTLPVAWSGKEPNEPRITV